MYTIPFAQVSNMYAIIQTSGRQARVEPGVSVTVDGTVAEPGAKVTLEQVLLVEKDGGEVLAGAPYVANARSSASWKAKRAGRKSASSRRSAAKVCAGPMATAPSIRASASQRFWCSNGS